MSVIRSAIALACLLSSAAFAQTSTVKVEGAWARATVQGQKGTGAFMKLTAPEGAQLVGASSPAAGVAEVHEMKMEGDVMKMRALPVLDLPAGQTVELKPGGYHIMLLDLKAPLAKDTTVPVTLTFKDAKGQQSQQVLNLPVGTTAPGGAAAPAADHGHGAHKH
jgi:copper(I)-binding protein